MQMTCMVLGQVLFISGKIPDDMGINLNSNNSVFFVYEKVVIPYKCVNVETKSISLI